MIGVSGVWTVPKRDVPIAACPVGSKTQRKKDGRRNVRVVCDLVASDIPIRNERVISV